VFAPLPVPCFASPTHPIHPPTSLLRACRLQLGAQLIHPRLQLPVVRGVLLRQSLRVRFVPFARQLAVRRHQLVHLGLVRQPQLGGPALPLRLQSALELGAVSVRRGGQRLLQLRGGGLPERLREVLFGRLDALLLGLPELFLAPPVLLRLRRHLLRQLGHLCHGSLFGSAHPGCLGGGLLRDCRPLFGLSGWGE
jgi:hypothetical protein